MIPIGELQIVLSKKVNLLLLINGSEISSSAIDEASLFVEPS